MKRELPADPTTDAILVRTAEMDSLRAELARRDVDVAHLRSIVGAAYQALVGYSEGDPAECIEKLIAENTRLRAALTKVSVIRDSIVGMQGFNFSEHAYPLVAALDEAGFPGAGYEIARANLGSLIEQRDRMLAVYFKAQQWRLYPLAPGAIAELQRAIDDALAIEKELANG